MGCELLGTGEPLVHLEAVQLCSQALLRKLWLICGGFTLS